MTEAIFVANAVMALLGVAVCVRHAYPDRDRLAFLGAGVVYGVLLEQLVIIRFDRYAYNVHDFLLVVADVPVVIGLGWTAIIYSGYHVGRRFDVDRRVLPLFVGLFALHIDLAIDAVAIRIPFWTWLGGGAWFGVPLGNFLGWFLVASLFTLSWDRLRPRLGGPLAAGASVPAAVAGLVVCLELWDAVATTMPRRVAILGSILLAAAALVAYTGLTFRPVDAELLAVPALYHGFYLAALLGLGIYRERPLLLVVSLAMIGLSGLLHADTFRTWRGRLVAT
ncbi:MAG: carotenoid biosynthesis protein [Haloarculaceae archaeon]